MSVALTAIKGQYSDRLRDWKIVKLFAVFGTAALGLLVGISPAPAQDFDLYTTGAPPDLSGNFVRPFEPIALSRPGGAASNPQVTSRKSSTVIVWVENREGRGAIRSLLLGDMRLQPEPYLKAIADVDAGTADCSSPVVVIDPVSGRPAFAWVESAKGENAIQFREDGSAPVTIWHSGNLLEFPSLEFDAQGSPYIAWSELIGGRSEAYAALRDANGGWATHNLSVALRPYDILPRVFGNAQGADLYWYSINGSDAQLNHSIIAGSGFSAGAPAGLDGIPAFRLPHLYRTGDDAKVGALWLEPTDAGEVYLDLDPRNVESATPQVVGRIGDVPALASVSNDATATKVWVERDGSASSTIVAQKPSSDHALREQVAGAVADPVIAVSDGWMHICWTVEDSQSGDKTLWYMRGN
ncbi:hypothetical protein BH09SUM1_BH09SUM1_05460 [soil metagenome]